MEFVFFWVVFSIAVGVFASVRRNRDGIIWSILALITSPLLAGIFVAILKERPVKDIPLASVGQRKSFFGPAVIILVTMMLVFLGVIASRIDPKAQPAKAPITRSTP